MRENFNFFNVLPARAELQRSVTGLARPGPLIRRGWRSGVYLSHVEAQRLLIPWSLPLNGWGESGKECTAWKARWGFGMRPSSSAAAAVGAAGMASCSCITNDGDSGNPASRRVGTAFAVPLRDLQVPVDSSPLHLAGIVRLGLRLQGEVLTLLHLSRRLRLPMALALKLLASEAAVIMPSIEWLAVVSR